MLGMVVVALSACEKRQAVAVNSPLPPAAEESSRVARRIMVLSEGDQSFENANMRIALRVYSRESEDKSPVVRSLAKRKIASVHEVSGNYGESLKILKELSTEKDNTIASDPLTILKTLYLSELMSDKKEFEAAMVRAAANQEKVYSVINDPRIAPGSRRNTLYSLATEAATARDWKLYTWALDHAASASLLSDQQLLQVAATLQVVDSARASAILRQLEPKLTGDDKAQATALSKKIKDTAAAPKDPANPKGFVRLNIEKFEKSGYWTTGAKPTFRNGPALMGTAR